MPADPAHLRQAGFDALARGDVDDAMASLRAAVGDGHGGAMPDAHHVLAGLYYFNDDFGPARHHLEVAFQGFRAGGELRRAARAAVDLAEIHASAFGNRAASRGWIARAARLLDRVGPCVEHGYLELALLACDIPDVGAVERSAAVALDLAHEYGDTDLEARALADSGLALVTQGRVRDGFARLDEAMAAISAGEVHDLGVAGKCFCAMLSACDRTGDVGRAEEWSRVVAETVFDPFGGRPRVLYTHCRAAYGSVLCNSGRWSDAETAMLDALGPTASAAFGHQVETSCRLAELRLLQGRAEEAAALIRPFEDHLAACAPLARVHVANREFDLAAAVIRRALEEMVADRLRTGPLLALLVEVELARDDLGAARVVVDELGGTAAGAESPVLHAEAALARARVALASGEHAAAIASFSDAQRCLAGSERPVLQATIRIELAAALAECGRAAAAIDEARAAQAIFERVGASTGVDRTAALLRSLGAIARPRRQVPAVAVGSLTAREREVLDLLRRGLTNAEIGERLYISTKTAEHHVSRVLAKLGVRSRAEAAAVAAAASPR
jgi:DNA-binding CsgD family transcriptional regulator